MRNKSTQKKEKFIQGKIIFSFSFSISVKQSRNLLYRDLHAFQMWYKMENASTQLNQ